MADRTTTQRFPDSPDQMQQAASLDVTAATLIDTGVYDFGDAGDGPYVMRLSYAAQVAEFQYDGTILTLHAANVGDWSITAAEAGKMSFQVVAGDLILENNTGQTETVRVQRVN